MTKTWSRDRTWKPSCYDVNPSSLTKNKPGRTAISPHHWNSIFCKQFNWYWDSDVLYLPGAPTTLLEGIRYQKPIPNPLAEAIGASEHYFFLFLLSGFEISRNGKISRTSDAMPCHEKKPGRHRARRIWRNEFSGSKKSGNGVENTHIFVYVCAFF